MFGKSGSGKQKMRLVENGEIVTDDKLNAQNFNEFFIDAVSSLAIEENRALLDDADEISNPVKRAIAKSEYYQYQKECPDINQIFLQRGRYH